MTFDGITIDIRKKIFSNIDTIIGYALKLVNKKIYFSTDNILQLIKLL
jgi:hypothetical protein